MHKNFKPFIILCT